MKKTFTILLSIIFYTSLYAQCPQGEITLNTQQEVDDFASTYPNCTELLDNLDIGDFNNPIDDLSGLEGITSIEGYLSVGRTTAPTLMGLHNISTVGGYLSIWNNNNLTDLTGLESLTSVGGDFDIQINANLTALTGVENLMNIGEDITIGNNPLLSTCNMPGICDFLLSGGMAFMLSNAPGCNDAAEVIDACDEIAFIEVFSFYDINQNQIQDATEPEFEDIVVQIGAQNTSYHSGNGPAYLAPGNYTVTFDQAAQPEWNLTTDSVSYFVMLEENEQDTVTFGVFTNTQTSHLQSSISSPPNRCNDSIIFDISVKNLGTTTASGTLWFMADENITSLDFIDLPDTTIAAFDTYGWYFTDLFPSQTLTKQAIIGIPGPPDFLPGEFLRFVAVTEFNDVNGDDDSEGFRYNPEIRCSFDPNDKLVHPAREGNYTLFEESIVYTIRFQNTGNDVAYDVVIRDTLDTNLDLESFNVLGTSHADELQTTLSETGILTFEFRDIFLPDSTSNFDGSQGYVTYVINPIDGLAENTIISNSAGIYFDLNPPIITNVVESLMVSELPVVSTSLADALPDFTITPNPNTGIFQVNGIPQGTYQIHDTTGRIIQSGAMKNDLSIDISTAKQGVYFIAIQLKNKTITKRIIKL